MALVNISADFTRVAAALERLADAAERWMPPRSTRPLRKVELQDVVRVSSESRAEAEVLRAGRRALGLDRE